MFILCIRIFTSQGHNRHFKLVDDPEVYFGPIVRNTKARHSEDQTNVLIITVLCPADFSEKFIYYLLTHTSIITMM